MTSLEDHPSTSIVKQLVIGDSGTGKTGALASLVLAGFKLGIIDFDNGLDIIKNILRDKKRPDLYKNVSYHLCLDPMKAAGVNLVPEKAVAWGKMVGLIGTAWGDGLPPVFEWGPDRILVLDSLTFAGKACLRHIQSLNNRLAVLPEIQDYNAAQKLQENLCAMLYSENIKCHVIVMSHVREVALTRTELDSKQRQVQVEIQGTRKGYAETGTGKAFSPMVGRYFNSLLMADMVGYGTALRRVIRTVPWENIGLKNSAPGLVKPEYSLETGLAEYFAAVTGQ